MKKAAPRSKIKPFLPVIGFFVALVAGGVAYAVSGPVHSLLIAQGVPDQVEFQYIIAAMIFLVVILLVALVYSIVAPKPPPEYRISEKALDKEKQDELRRKRMIKERKRKMREEMGRANRDD